MSLFLSVGVVENGPLKRGHATFSVTEGRHSSVPMEKVASPLFNSAVKNECGLPSAAMEFLIISWRGGMEYEGDGTYDAQEGRLFRIMLEN